MNKDLTKIEPAKTWAIIAPIKNDFFILGYTTERTRAESIKSFISTWSPDHPCSKWRWWRRRGYKAIRVTVKAAEGE